MSTKEKTWAFNGFLSQRLYVECGSKECFHAYTTRHVSFLHYCFIMKKKSPYNLQPWFPPQNSLFPLQNTHRHIDSLTVWEIDSPLTFGGGKGFTSILKKTPLYSYVFCIKGRIINSSLKKNKERNETIIGLRKLRPWEKTMGFLVQVQRQHQTAQSCYLQNVKKEKQLGKFLNFDHLCRLSVICSK